MALQSWRLGVHNVHQQAQLRFDLDLHTETWIEMTGPNAPVPTLVAFFGQISLAVPSKT
jgi:hypothetical protein